MKKKNNQIALGLFVFSCIIGISTLLFCSTTDIGTYIGRNSLFGFPAMGNDSDEYVRLAQTLRHDFAFSLSIQQPITPESFRTPGYPGFLALILSSGLNLVSVSVVQVVLFALTISMVFLLGTRLFSEQIAFVAASILALEPTGVFYSIVILSDIPFLFCLVTALFLFFLPVKRERYHISALAGAGFFLGIGMLTRSIGQFLPLLFVGFLCFKYRKNVFTLQVATYISTLVLGIALCTVPWMIRNQLKFGTFALASTGSFNFGYYNLPLFVAQKTNRSLDYARAEVLGELISVDFIHLRSFPFAPKIQKQVNDALEAHGPFRYAWFHLIKTIPFFLTDGYRDIARQMGMPISSFPNISNTLLTGNIGSLITSLSMTPAATLILFICGVLLWSIITILFIFGFLWTCTREKTYRPEKIFLFLVVAYFAMLTGPVANARYRLPVVPILLLFAMSGGTIVVQTIQKRIL